MSLQGRTDITRDIYALRLTWQATPRNKLTGFFDYQPECTSGAWLSDSDACRNSPPGDGWIQGGSQINNFFGAGPNSPETGDYSYNRNRVEQVKWQSPATNRLLLESSMGVTWSRWGYEARPGGPSDDLIRVQEQAAIPGVGLAGLKYRSSNRPHGRSGAYTWNGAASYVTGAHNMKFGYMGGFLHDIDTLINVISNSQRLAYRFNNGVPNQITQQAGDFCAQGAHRVRLVLRAGSVDARPADAAGRGAVRPRVEPLPAADDQQGRLHPCRHRHSRGRRCGRLQRHLATAWAPPTICAATASRR